MVHGFCFSSFYTWFPFAEANTAIQGIVQWIVTASISICWLKIAAKSLEPCSRAITDAEWWMMCLCTVQSERGKENCFPLSGSGLFFIMFQCGEVQNYKLFIKCKNRRRTVPSFIYFVIFYSIFIRLIPSWTLSVSLFHCLYFLWLRVMEIGNSISGNPL